MDNLLSGAAPVGSSEGHRLMVDAKQFGRMIGVSERTIRRYDSEGIVPRPVKLGAAIRWRLEEVQDWISVGCPRRTQWEPIRQANQQRGGKR